MTCQSKVRYWTLFWPNCARAAAGTTRTSRILRTRRRSIGPPGSDGLRQTALGRVAPQSLELVEGPERRVEHVHDEVHVIHQHPAALRQPFHHIGPDTIGLQRLDDVLGDGPDVRI